MNTNKTGSCHSAVVAQRMTDFADRADVRQQAILLVAGLISPFDYVENISKLALGAGLDNPVVLN